MGNRLGVVVEQPPGLDALFHRQHGHHCAEFVDRDHLLGEGRAQDGELENHIGEQKCGGKGIQRPKRTEQAGLQLQAAAGLYPACQYKGSSGEHHEGQIDEEHSPPEQQRV